MQTRSPSQLAVERAISILGGPAQAARLLNVREHRHQTIQSWIRTRVPAEWCPPIERLTTELGDPVLCEELRPDMAWNVVRERPAAVPAVG